MTAAAGPTGRLDRAGPEAVRFAAEARRLARRYGRALGPAREEILDAAAEVDAAAEKGKPEKLSAALLELSRLWDTHLAPRQRPWLDTLRLVAIAIVLAAGTRAFVLDTVRVTSVSMEPTLLPGDVLLVQRSVYAVPVPFTHLRLFETGTPRRGDIVVFDDPRQPGGTYVKRVIGVPGDVVELREQVLHVNGVAQPRTLLGDYALGAEDEAEPGASICRRFREAVAAGALSTPFDDQDGEARWHAAAAAGVASYDVLQCRRVREAAREGPFEVVRPGHVFVLGDNRDHSADSRGLGGWQIPYGHLRGRTARVLLSWGEGGSWFRGSAGLRFERLFKAVATR